MSIEQMISNRLQQLSDEVSKRAGHKNPMYYKALENYRWCRIVHALLNGDQPAVGDIEAVCGVKAARTSTTQPDVLSLLREEVVEGVNVMDIINRHRDIPNVHDLLKQAIADEGYVVEGFYIISQ